MSESEEAIGCKVEEYRRLIDHVGYLQGQLLQAQKLETIGMLTEGIVHRFNNVIGIIMGYTELAMMNICESTGETKIRPYLEQVMKSARCAKDIVKQIDLFGHPDHQERKAVLMSFVLEESITFMKTILPATIEIRSQIDVTPQNGMVLGIPAQICHVVMNVCISAAHALKDGRGVLDVSLGVVAVEPDDGAWRLDLKQGSYVRLSVSHAGLCMDADRVYAPYLLAKDGTAHWLSMSHVIVKAAGGAMIVQNEPGEGTTLHVFLPRTILPAHPESDGENDLKNQRHL